MRDEGQSQQQLADVMGIHLTAAAHDLLARAQRVADEQETQLLACIDEADRSYLIALLQRLAVHTGLSPGVHPGLRDASRPY